MHVWSARKILHMQTQQKMNQLAIIEDLQKKQKQEYNPAISNTLSPGNWFMFTTAATLLTLDPGP